MAWDRLSRGTSRAGKLRGKVLAKVLGVRERFCVRKALSWVSGLRLEK